MKRALQLTALVVGLVVGALLVVGLRSATARGFATGEVMTNVAPMTTDGKAFMVGWRSGKVSVCRKQGVMWSCNAISVDQPVAASPIDPY